MDYTYHITFSNATLLVQKALDWEEEVALKGDNNNVWIQR